MFNHLAALCYKDCIRLIVYSKATAMQILVGLREEKKTIGITSYLTSYLLL